MTPTQFALPGNHAELVAATTPHACDVPLPSGVRIGTFRGYPAWLVDTPWSTAAVSMFGGQLLSFVPHGQQEVLWVSPLAAAIPTPIRGGTPVIWPFFGGQDQTAAVPYHGFVRNLHWMLLEATTEGDGSVRLRLVPPVLDGLSLRLEMELCIGETLEQRLTTRNDGMDAVVFTEALHNYFRVGDVERMRVRGVDGLTYLDKNRDFMPFVQRGDWDLHDPADPGRSDRIHGEAGGTYVLVDPDAGRCIELRVDGGRALVVWSPGAEVAARMHDIGADAWKQFVCLEPANAGDWRVALPAGETHVLMQRIRVLPGAR